VLLKQERERDGWRGLCLLKCPLTMGRNCDELLIRSALRPSLRCSSAFGSAFTLTLTRGQDGESMLDANRGLPVAHDNTSVDRRGS
jgi:hypothetical protein